MICFKTGNPRTTAAEAAVYAGGVPSEVALQERPAIG